MFKDAKGLKTYSDVVDIYDFSTNLWSKATLSLARAGLSATSVGTKAFFAGGMFKDAKGVNLVTDLVDIYDSSTNSWSTATLSQARTALSATSLGTKAFFAGGVYDAPRVSDVIDILSL